MMKKFPLSVLVVTLIAFAGCGDGGGRSDLSGDESFIPDVPQDIQPDHNGTDVPTDETADAADGADHGQDVAGNDSIEPVDVVDAGDTPLDAPMELPEPDAAFVWEIRNRQGCVADGPWKVDRVLRLGAGTAGLGDVDVETAVVVSGRVWLVSDGRLLVADLADPAAAGFSDVTAELAGSPAMAIQASGDVLLVATGAGIESFDSARVHSVVSSTPMEYARILQCDGEIWAVAAGRLYLIQEAPFEVVLEEGAGEVVSLACLDGDVVVGATGGVFSGPGGDMLELRWEPGDDAIVDVAAGNGIVVAVTATGLAVIDAASWQSTLVEPGIGGLPAGGMHQAAVSADGRRVAIAHEVGCTLLDLLPGRGDALAVNRIDVGGVNQAVVDHFNSARWLPSDTVNSVAFGQDGETLWVSTAAGISRIRPQQLVLADKAAEMMGNLDRWFWRLDGFVTAEAGFESATSDVRLQLRDNDNDGQWTQEAVGAFCYAYRVTGDERYYEAARKAITNMCMLIDVPAQDFIDAGLGRGFVTRSFVRDDEGELFTEKAALSNWHLVDYMDGHQYYWKDDTSSDEMTGHFYGFSIYHDLCAKDDTERAWVASHLTDLVSYIVTHGYRLLDLDGEPTEHGKYGPEYLAVAVDGLEACTLTYDMETCIGAWGGGAFLDSTEILGGLLAAWHVSGDRRFYDAYESLISEHRYDELATFNEFVMTWTNPQIANYCDHELSDLALLTLIRYEQRPDRRAIWIKSMLDAWQYEVGERNPLKTLTMAAALADIEGIDGGVSTLLDFPEDQRDYPYDNSHRVDAGSMGKDRFQKPQFDTVFPYDEIHTMRWDSNPYRKVGGGSATQRRAPNFWLLPYWGLRYYGVICD